MDGKPELITFFFILKAFLVLIACKLHFVEVQDLHDFVPIFLYSPISPRAFLNPQTNKNGLVSVKLHIFPMESFADVFPG